MSEVTLPLAARESTRNHAARSWLNNTWSMERWTCPNCKRIFGKLNQSHMTCEPAMTLEEYFAGAKSFERSIFDAVNTHLSTLEGVIVDPLGIGILFKNGPMFAELRPKTKWVALGFSLSRKLTSGRLSRKVVDNGNKHFHVINVDDPALIDDEVFDWLTEAYHLAGGTSASRSRPANKNDEGDGMVPDDIEDPFA